MSSVKKFSGLSRAALLLGLFLTGPAGARTLIQQAMEAGTLDLETATLYQVWAIQDPGAVPEEYRELPAHPQCGTPVVAGASRFLEQTSGASRARLHKALARPVLDHDYLSLSGHFRVHYDLEGNGWVDRTDADGNGVPDYVDVVAAVLDSTWELQVNLLGYQAPPPDPGLAGGNEYDVYIVELGTGGYYGLTYPEDSSRLSTHSYLKLDNNYTDSIYEQTRELDALRVTVAHEFFHAIHFGYYLGNDSGWWREASSTWMEEVAYPEMDDYLQYVPHFLRQPERSLDSGVGLSSDTHVYGASIFAHFLDQRFDRDLIRLIWEEIARHENARLERFDQVIGRQTEYQLDLGDAMSEFAVWNYFTGRHHQEGRFYHEGEKYGGVRARDLSVPTGAEIAVEDSGLVAHMASAYIRLEPQLRPGGVTLEVVRQRGQWSRQLLLVGRDSLEIQPVRSDLIRVSGWDRYEEVVLVLVVKNLTGFGYPYRVTAEYDPAFTDEIIPLALHLKQNYPNPFRPGAQTHTVLPFDLSRPSTSTRLSIFSVDGRLVRLLEMGSQLARSHTATWDGRNQAGKLVESGIYFYVLEADGTRRRRKMAVVRE